MLFAIYGQCRVFNCYAESHFAECHCAVCHFAECHYAESHFAECHYAERRGAGYRLLLSKQTRPSAQANAGNPY